MRYILGISAFYHDAAAALMADGEIVAAAQEERFTRQKHSPDFPVHAIQYCLNYAGIGIDALDAVVFYDKPLLKFERLLQTYYAFAPRGLASFLRAMPVWTAEKLFLKKQIRDGLGEVGDFNPKKLRLLFTQHHQSHAAAAFFPSPFEKAAILTIDGVGEWATASIGIGEGNKVRLLKELHFPHSPGLLYSAFTYFLGFRVNSGEYKLMGLAPYGRADAPETLHYVEQIKTRLVDVKSDGSIWLDQAWFDYASGLRMIKERKWADLFGFSRRLPEAELLQCHCDLALAIQQVTEEIVLKMALEARRLTGAEALCMAGGVALNCTANGRLLRAGVFKDLYIQPAAGDAGSAVGAALAAHYLYFDEKRSAGSDAMKGACLGPAYTDAEAAAMNANEGAVARRYDDFSALCSDIAQKIAEGAVVGWFQGRMEFGPRALGNRSILGDPRRADMQQKMNLKIKNRESFRPFAPAVLEEDAATFFDLDRPSPYMLATVPLRAEYRNELPVGYAKWSLVERLRCARSAVPAVTHLDFSARVQTVARANHPEFWQLLCAFKAQTGLGMLINTSFNVRGEPIVCAPSDAYRCFMQTEMDYLVVGHFVYDKKEQAKDSIRWKRDFEAD